MIRSFTLAAVAAAAFAFTAAAQAASVTTVLTQVGNDYVGGGFLFAQEGSFSDQITFTGGPSDGVAYIAFQAFGVGPSSFDVNGAPISISSVGPLQFGSGSFAFTGGTLVLNVSGVAGQAAGYTYLASVSAVPEPSTVVLLLAGLCAVGFVSARRRRS